MKSVLCVFALLLIAGSATADIVVPASFANSSIGNGLSTPIRALPRQHQSYYNPANFTTSVPASTTIVGLQLRLTAPASGNAGLGATWPAADLSFSDFTIRLGRPSAAITTAGEIPSLTPTFASNMLGAVTTRSGPLTITANSFANNGSGAAAPFTPASFGFLFSFTTPYTINPGEGLVVYVSHSGFGGTENIFFDSAPYTPNLIDGVSALNNTSAAPTGFTDAIVYNLVQIPAPASASMLALGGLVALRRRR